MGNSIYNQLHAGAPAQNNNIIQKLAEFKRTFSGDPRETIQRMLNSGQISQAQLNQYAKQADEIYKIFK